MSSKQANKIKENIKRLPDSPGVYMMKDEKGKIVYVGKAKKLNQRVRNYLRADDNLDVKTRSLMGTVAAIDYIVTENEKEALILECNLIKEYRPRYNVRLKDDKRYPYLKLTVNEKYPRLFLVRNIKSDGAEYFGPYTDTGMVRHNLKIIQSIFQLRSCPNQNFSDARSRECLNFQIKRCLAPCTGRVNREDYQEVVNQVRLFLKGRSNRLIKNLEARMRRLSAADRFEEASVVRDQILSLEKIRQRQHAVSPGGKDEDIVALATERGKACGVVIRVREGKILSSESFLLPDVENDDINSICDVFLKLYYHSSTDIPAKIYTQLKPVDGALIEEWLREKTGKKVSLAAPRKGHKKQLVALAEKNASLKLLVDKGRRSDVLLLLGEVKRTLGIHSTPFRVEAFDVSNIQGSDAVGSMVTFENGKPLKSGYRLFKIREVEGVDDFSMLREILKRRFESLQTGKSRHPDLILVDGGRGQVTAGQRAMEECGVGGISLIGLAKRNEEIYQPGKKDVIKLPSRSPVLKFLQRIRDEAHRFAVSYHRKLRSKGIRKSNLDEVPGIGEKRKLQLLVAFGSLERLRAASPEEIASLPGIGEKIAQKIFEHIHR
ncbi:MAG: excinuclease ABC subunit UvrC [Candidatus Krumholzibacteriota bacterium]|nr:excinuclease ABC subunit UvrC [Candidatus Krumholzibacteriota bacterium]